MRTRTSDAEKSGQDKTDSGSNVITAGDVPKPTGENEDDLDYLTADGRSETNL